MLSVRKAIAAGAILIVPVASAAGPEDVHTAAATTNGTPPAVTAPAKPPTNADFVDPLNRYLAGTPMAGTGQDFYDVEVATGVKKELLMAIAYAETSYNRNPQRGSKYNVFSICSYDSTNTTCHYGSYREAIFAAAATLTDPKTILGRRNYRTIGDLSRAGNCCGPIWASSPSNWQRNVTTEVTRITGKPAGPEWVWRTK